MWSFRKMNIIVVTSVIFGTTCSIFRVHFYKVVLGNATFLSSIKRHTFSLEHPPSNRSLIILTGELRSGEQAWTSLYRNFLDPNSADLALMIENPLKSLYPNSTLLDRAKYKWFFEDYKDWGDAVDLINGTSWRATHLTAFKSLNQWCILCGGTCIDDFDGSAIIIFMIRWFLANNIMESDILNRYDTFVVTRTDHFYQCPHYFTRLVTAIILFGYLKEKNMGDILTGTTVLVKITCWYLWTSLNDCFESLLSLTLTSIRTQKDSQSTFGIAMVSMLNHFLG